MSYALLLEGVSKRYAHHVAVRDLALRVPTGSIYGILGPNGAGKSSTLRIALNIIGRDGGDVTLLGQDPAVEPAILRRVGYLPEERGLYRKMRVLDVIVFFGRIKGMSATEARRSAERWLERMELTQWSRSRVDTLSKGMQQKVQLIATLVHSPDLLILDEPASGLDPMNQEVLREIVLEARDAGRTVILSTHHMEQAERLCDSVCIIANGSKVLDGELREIRRQHRGRRWRIEFEHPSAEASAFMEQYHWFDSALHTGDGWEVEMSADTDTRDLLEALSRLDLPITRLEHLKPSLHQIFLERVGQTTMESRPEGTANA